MKGVSAESRKDNQMLKQVQHEMQTLFFSFLSSQTCFGISVLVLESGFKAPACGRGPSQAAEDGLRRPLLLQYPHESQPPRVHSSIKGVFRSRTNKP
jgi:hypothetical protein